MVKYRLAVAVDVEPMHGIAEALTSSMPDLAAAIKDQARQIQDSGVNIFGPYEVAEHEDQVGLTEGEIVHLTGITD